MRHEDEKVWQIGNKWAGGRLVRYPRTWRAGRARHYGNRGDHVVLRDAGHVVHGADGGDVMYRVLIVVKDKWWSDQKTFRSFGEARTHQKEIAAQWNDCETAIMAPDSRVLNFKESLQFRKQLTD